MMIITGNTISADVEALDKLMSIFGANMSIVATDENNIQVNGHRFTLKQLDDISTGVTSFETPEQKWKRCAISTMISTGSFDVLFEMRDNNMISSEEFTSFVNEHILICDFRTVKIASDTLLKLLDVGDIFNSLSIIQKADLCERLSASAIYSRLTLDECVAILCIRKKVSMQSHVSNFTSELTDENLMDLLDNGTGFANCIISEIKNRKIVPNFKQAERMINNYNNIFTTEYMTEICKKMKIEDVVDLRLSGRSTITEFIMEDMDRLTDELLMKLMWYHGSGTHQKMIEEIEKRKIKPANDIERLKMRTFGKFSNQYLCS
jgi:hypothetical protein